LNSSVRGVNVGALLFTHSSFNSIEVDAKCVDDWVTVMMMTYVFEMYDYLEVPVFGRLVPTSTFVFALDFSGK